jgi:hypothetical protein
MKMPKFILTAFIFSLGSVILGQEMHQGIIPNSIQYKKPNSLFNGKNLKGWYTFVQKRGKNVDPKHVFTVVDRQIRISGEEWGCITTKKAYENYRLKLEFRWGGKTQGNRIDKARDSGLLLHSNGEDGGSAGIWMHSIECQIIEGGTGDILVVGDGSEKFSITASVATEKQAGSFRYQEGGLPAVLNKGRLNWYGRDENWQDVIGFKGKQDIEKTMGEWNTLECIANGNELIVYLNGVLVNRAREVRPSKGRIQIQSEGAEIYFRNIELSKQKKSRKNELAGF